MNAARGAIVARRIEPGATGRYHALPRSLLAPLRSVLDRPIPLDSDWRLPRRDGPAALRWLLRVWEDHLNQKLKASEFLEETVLRAEG